MSRKEALVQGKSEYFDEEVGKWKSTECSKSPTGVHRYSSPGEFRCVLWVGVNKCYYCGHTYTNKRICDKR